MIPLFHVLLIPLHKTCSFVKIACISQLYGKQFHWASQLYWCLLWVRNITVGIKSSFNCLSKVRKACGSLGLPVYIAYSIFTSQIFSTSFQHFLLLHLLLWSVFVPKVYSIHFEKLEMLTFKSRKNFCGLAINSWSEEITKSRRIMKGYWVFFFFCNIPKSFVSSSSASSNTFLKERKNYIWKSISLEIINYNITPF